MNQSNFSISSEQKNRILLAIPARGGSKRLRRKNVADLQGKPMLAYTIEAALKSELSPHVYVCTEDAEIAEVAKKYGAQVYSISESMALDDVSSTVPCLSLFETLSKNGVQIDYIFNLQPTSPLRSHHDIRLAYQTLVQQDGDFLVSVTPIDPHYFHWGVVEKKPPFWEMYFGKEFLKERIYLPTVHRPNGAIKAGKSGPLQKTKNFFGEKMLILEMPEQRSIHVATQFDLVCTRAQMTASQEEI